MKRAIPFAIALVIASAGRSQAQAFVSPFVGVTLTSPSATGGRSKPGYGVAFGGFGGIVGFETELAYYPEVLDNSANGLSKSRVLTFTGDTLIGPKIGSWKPYGAFGFGNMNLNVTSLANAVVPNPENVSSNYFTLNVGGGAVGSFAAHIGARADLRYFKAYGFNLTDLEGAGLALDHFDFWRASIGIAFVF
jgi:hypothetical protein